MTDTDRHGVRGINILPLLVFFLFTQLSDVTDLVGSFDLLVVFLRINNKKYTNIVKNKQTKLSRSASIISLKTGYDDLQNGPFMTLTPLRTPSKQKVINKKEYSPYCLRTVFLIGTTNVNI